MQLNALTHIVFDDSPIDEGTIVGKLFPSEGAFWDFIIQLIAMVILFLVIIFIAYKPVKKLLNKRAEYVASNIASSEQAKKDAQIVLAKKDEFIDEGKKEAQRIIEEARIQAGKEGEALIASAKLEAASIRKKADQDAEAALKNAEIEARERIVDVALAASTKLLEREVDSEDNRRMVASFVDDIEKGN